MGERRKQDMADEGGAERNAGSLRVGRECVTNASGCGAVLAGWIGRVTCGMETRGLAGRAIDTAEACARCR